MPDDRPDRVRECDVSRLELSAVDEPYAVEVPYSTWVSEASLVVQLMTAPELVMPVLLIAEITGGVVSIVDWTVIDPFMPLMGTPMPSGSEATNPPMVIGMEPAGVPDAIETLTTATCPAPRTLRFRSNTITLTPPLIAFPIAFFCAAAAADPVEVDTYVREDANIRSNCRELTLTDPGVNDTLRFTLEPAGALADPVVRIAAVSGVNACPGMASPKLPERITANRT